MKKNHFLTILITLFSFYNFSKTPIDKEEKVISSCEFGNGKLQYINAVVSATKSANYFAFVDENKNQQWKTPIPFDEMPYLTAFYAFTQGSNTTYRSNGTSNTAYAVKTYLKGKTNINRFYKIDISGKIDYKDIEDNVLFPFLTKEHSLDIYSSFIAKNKFYLIYQIYKYDPEKDIEKKFFIVELGSDLKPRIKEMEDAYVNMDEWKQGKSSYIRAIEQNDDYFMYYKIVRNESKLEFKIYYLEYKELSSSEKYSVEVPLDIQKQEIEVSAKNRSSLNYNECIHSSSGPRLLIEKKKGEKPIYDYRGTRYVFDLTQNFNCYLLGKELYFFGEYGLTLERGVFIFKIDLNNESIQVAEPVFTSFKSFSNSKLLFEGKECSVIRVEFNPKTKDLLLQTAVRYDFKDYKLRYYNIEEGVLTEVKSSKGYLIPDPYLAIHQEYLETNGKYNFPKSTAYTILYEDNVWINESNREVTINYFKSDMDALTTTQKGKNVEFTYPKE